MSTENTPREARIRALLDWLHAHGARLGRCRVEAAPGRGAGLVAAEDMEPEDEILFVPRDLWVTVKTPHTAYGPVLRHVGRDEGLLDGGMARLALLLALERGRPDSHFAPYLAELPQPSVPDGLSGGDLAALQSPQMARWVCDQREEAEAAYALLAEELPGRFPGSFPQGTFDLQTWRWAYGHALQRSFSVDLDGEEVWGQIPGMGFCNHDGRAKNTYYAEEDGWLFEAGQAWRAGEAIVIDYGSDKSSVDFFLYYGFVPPENPNDRVRVRLQGDGPAGRDGCVLGGDGALPTWFLTEAAAWASGREVRSDAQGRVRPRDEGRALTALASAIRTRLAGFPTSLQHDHRLLADESRQGLERAIVAYRYAFKRVLASAAEALERRAQDAAAGRLAPSEQDPDEADDGVYELVSVTLERPPG